jgi:hypothetical protein
MASRTTALHPRHGDNYPYTDVVASECRLHRYLAVARGGLCDQYDRPRRKRRSRRHASWRLWALVIRRVGALAGLVDASGVVVAALVTVLDRVAALASQSAWVAPAGLPVSWCIAAGRALDLFRGRQTRDHDDVEIAVPRTRFAEIVQRLPNVHFYVPLAGTLVPACPETLAAGHQT